MKSKLRNNKPSIIYGFTLTNTGVMLVLVIIQAIVIYWKINEKTGKSILRGLFSATCRLIVLNFSLVFVSMSTLSLSLLRQYILEPLSWLIRPRKYSRFFIGWRSIRLENTVSLHVFFSIFLVFWGVLHTALALALFYFKFPESIANTTNPSIVPRHGVGKNLTSTNTRVTNLRKHLYENSHADSFMIITGLIGTSILAIISITSLPYIRRRLHELFYYSHYLFLPLITTVVLHAGAKKIWIFSLLLFLVDKMVGMLLKRKYTTIDIKVRPISKKSYELSFPKSYTKIGSILSSANTSGQHVYICCPEISMFQWHPFDLSSGNDEKEHSVLISIQGNWTQQFYSRLVDTDTGSQNSDLENLKECVPLSGQEYIPCTNTSIWVSRPYYSSISHILENDIVILVAGGTGISTMLSIIKNFIFDASTGSYKYRLKTINLIWACKDIKLFESLNEIVNLAAATDTLDKISIMLFYTGSESREHVNYVLGDMISESSHGVGLSFGRPQLHDIFTSVVSLHSYESTIGITSFGPEPLKRTTMRVAKKWSLDFRKTSSISYY